MSEERVSIPLNTINDVLTYLGRRPYDEAAALIAAVHQSAQPVEEAEDAEEG